MKHDYNFRKDEKTPLWRNFMLTLLMTLLTLGASLTVNAQNYEVTGEDANNGQSTEIGLNGSTIGKFYYLFRIDQAGGYHSVTFQVGQGEAFTYAPQKDAGTYVIYEFDDFKDFPIGSELNKIEGGVKQMGKIVISNHNDQ